MFLVTPTAVRHRLDSPPYPTQGTRVLDITLTLLGLLAALILLVMAWRHYARRRGGHQLLSHRSFYTTWGGAKNLGPRDRIPNELRDDYRKNRDPVGKPRGEKGHR